MSNKTATEEKIQNLKTDLTNKQKPMKAEVKTIEAILKDIPKAQAKVDKLKAQMETQKKTLKDKILNQGLLKKVKAEKAKIKKLQQEEKERFGAEFEVEFEVSGYFMASYERESYGEVEGQITVTEIYDPSSDKDEEEELYINIDISQEMDIYPRNRQVRFDSSYIRSKLNGVIPDRQINKVISDIVNHLESDNCWEGF
jgi:hypothetical protein